MDALVLAGAANNGKLQDISSATNEAFIKVLEKPMLEYILNALRDAENIDKIVVSGPKEEIEKIKSLSYDKVVESGYDILDTIIKGLNSIDTQEEVLIATSDIPLLTSEAIDDFISNTKLYKADVYYPVITKEDTERLSPEAKRTYVPLLEGVFTGGNLAIVRARAISENQDMIRKATQMRKEPLKLCKLLGIKCLLKFLLRKLSIKEIENKLENIMGFKGIGIVSKYPELGMDVDKPDDFRIIEKIMESRLSSP